MVVALIIIGTYIKPQHKLLNLHGHKKDEKLIDINRDRVITMVLDIQQTNQKISWFVLQQ